MRGEAKRGKEGKATQSNKQSALRHSHPCHIQHTNSSLLSYLFDTKLVTLVCNDQNIDMYNADNM
jgi:hypothetical protein